jgi:oligosaccharide repeat unit polymerase
VIDFGIIDKLIAIFFSLAILLNGYIIGKRVKTFLFPASLFCFFWFAYTFFPLVILFDVPINPISIFFIFVCTLFFSFSAFLFKWSIAFQRNQEKLNLPKNYFSNSFLKRIFKLLTIVIIASIILDLIIQGFSISDFLSNRFLLSSAEYAKLRYNEELQGNIYSKIIVTLTYVTAVLGGVLAASALKVKDSYVFFLTSVIPAVMVMLIQSSKGLMQLSIVFYFSGVLIVNIFNNNLRISSRKINKRIIYFGLVSFPLLVLSFLSRGGSEGDSEFKLNFVLNKLSTYTLAHLYAFSDWFSFYLFNNSIDNYVKNYALPGFYSFMGIFRLFGDNTYVPLGTYDEYFSYKEVFTTNIYTMYRGSIDDFGILGTFIFIFIIGIIFNSFYYLLLYFKRPLFSMAFFSVMISYFQMAPFISLFMYNSIFFTLMILTIIYALNDKKWSFIKNNFFK